MWPDRAPNQGPLTYESGALPTALRGVARRGEKTEEERSQHKFACRSLRLERNEGEGFEF